MTLTYEYDPDSVKVNQHVTYQGQKSSRLQVIIQTFKETYWYR